MGLRRVAYIRRGANYTPWATLLRCVRADQSSATVRCHYLTDGAVSFAFTLRKQEFFIPAGILLKCFIEVRRVYQLQSAHVHSRQLSAFIHRTCITVPIQIPLREPMQHAKSRGG